MNEIPYPMIFKRKSLLEKHIRVEIKIVPKNETTCKRGEYCILLFSEKKRLKNIGYIKTQLDL